MTTYDLLTALADVSAPDVTVLSGAGVSIEGPSCLPSGAALTRRAFDGFFLPGTLEVLCHRHEAVGWHDASPCPRDASAPPRVRLPRLETVLGVAARVYGPDAIDQVLVDVATAEPNRLHHFFAEHLAAGGDHLTANFDTCVERAGRVRSLGWPESDLLHFHRAIGGREPLGATLAEIESGFTGDVATRFTTLLGKRPVLLVAGYSGSDFFDVNALVARLPAGSLTRLRVVWLWHSDHDPHLVSVPVPPADQPAFTLFDILRRRERTSPCCADRPASRSTGWHGSGASRRCPPRGNPGATLPRSRSSPGSNPPRPSCCTRNSASSTRSPPCSPT